VRLTVIGCSGSFPGPDSPASCYLLEVDVPGADRPYRVLLDLGNGALGALQAVLARQGTVPPGLVELDAVLLSHLHPDHCLDLCGLYVALKYHPSDPARGLLPVYGPTGTLARLVDGYGTESSGSLTEVYAVHEWQDGGELTLGPLRVHAHRVAHPVESYGLRLEHDGRVLGYTGDTDTCPGALRVAEGADLLLADASFVEGRDTVRGVHLTGRRAGEVARDAGAARLVLTHIPVWTDPGTVHEEARAVFPGPVELAGPGRTYEV